MKTVLYLQYIKYSEVTVLYMELTKLISEVSI